MSRRRFRLLAFGAVVIAAFLLATTTGDSRESLPSQASVAASKRPGWVRPPNARRIEPPKAYTEYAHSYVLAASYYDTRGRWESRLMLNNKGADDMRPRVTLYARDGRAFTVPDVVVPGDQFLELDLNELARQAGGSFQQGSVRVVYYGKELEMGAQVVVRDLDRGLQFDEQLTYQSAGAENRREAVWWLPTGRATLAVVLTNRTDEPVTVRAQLHGAAPGGDAAPPGRRGRFESVRLGPRELQVLDFGSGERGAQSLGPNGGITVEFDGPAGAVMARGFVEDVQSRYAMSVPFTGVSGQSSAYHGGGVRLAGPDGSALEPVILARNTSDSATTVNGRLAVSRENGLVEFIALPSTALGPGETARIEAATAAAQARLISDRAAVGLEFEYASAPGTVVMNMVSVTAGRDRTYQVPLYDAESLKSSTGGYPWRAAGPDQTTVIYLKNTSLVPQRYVLQLSFPGGAWAPGQKVLEPGQTLAIDVARIRDEQEPDAFGRTIPLDAEGGQVHWSIKGRDRHAMIGRVEFIDGEHGVSATYACINCCPDNPIWGWGVDDPTVVTVGDSIGLQVMIQYQDCYETQLQPHELGWSEVDWFIDDAGIASGDGWEERVVGVSTGATTFHATYNAEFWYPEHEGELAYCAFEPIEVPFEAEVEVACHRPQNLVRQAKEDLSNGQFRVQVRWNTDPSWLQVAACEIGEHLSYNSWPNPPFTSASLPSNYPSGGYQSLGPAGKQDPTQWDYHTTGGQPLSGAAGTATTQQVYQFRCSCAGSDSSGSWEKDVWTPISGPYGGTNTISRILTAVGPLWSFRTTKSSTSYSEDTNAWTYVH